MEAPGQRQAGPEPLTIQSLPEDLVKRILEEVSRQSKGMRHATVCRDWAELAPGCARSAVVTRRYQLPSLSEVPNLEALALVPDLNGPEASWSCGALTYDRDPNDGQPLPFRSSEIAAALSNRRRLRSLKLQGCKNIPDDVFDLPALKVLRILRGFQEKTQGADPLSRLSSLERLEVDTWHEKTTQFFTAGVGSLRCLWSLSLACDSGSFPPSIHQVSSLRVLKLKLNCYGASAARACLEDVCRLTSLRELTVSLPNSPSRESVLPAMLGNLTALRALSLGEGCGVVPDSLSQLAGQLKSLKVLGKWDQPYPEVVAELTGPTHLHLVSWRATEVPQSLSRLTCLTSLKLEGKFRTVPDFFSAFPDLETLELRSSNLICLPPSLRQLAKLRDLDAFQAKLCANPDDPSPQQRAPSLAPGRESNVPEEASGMESNMPDEAPGREANVPAPRPPDLVAGAQQLEPGVDAPALEPSTGSVLPQVLDLDSRVRKLAAALELPRLESLSLSFAEEPGIDLPASVGSLTSLQELRLSSRHQRWLGLDGYAGRLNLPSSLGSLLNLRVLVISRQRMNSLPASLGSLSSLEDLCLSKLPQLEDIPESIGQLEALEVLRILDCPSLKQLPSSLGNLKNLATLNLTHSGWPQREGPQHGPMARQWIDTEAALESLPASLGDLTALRTLVLSGYKKLLALPECFSRLTALEVLVLDSLGLTSLGPELGHMRSLRFLFLQDQWSWMGISCIPDNIGSLTSLRELHILLQEVRTLPDSIANLTSLRKLTCLRFVKRFSPVIERLVAAAGLDEAGQPRVKVEAVSSWHYKVPVSEASDFMKWVIPWCEKDWPGPDDDFYEGRVGSDEEDEDAWWEGTGEEDEIAGLEGTEEGEEIVWREGTEGEDENVSIGGSDSGSGSGSHSSTGSGSGSGSDDSSADSSAEAGEGTEEESEAGSA